VQCPSFLAQPKNQSSPTPPVSFALTRAGIKDLRLHDLRRTMGSRQAGTGANLSVIGRSLNHTSTATTAIYARLWPTPVRNSMETAATAMLQAAALDRAPGSETGMTGE